MADMEVDPQQSSIADLNDCRHPKKSYLPTIKARDLVVGDIYHAPTMRKVKTRYGINYVVENGDFSMFLPKKYSKLNVLEYSPNRYFRIVSFEEVNGKEYADIEFLLQ